MSVLVGVCVFDDLNIHIDKVRGHIHHCGMDQDQTLCLSCLKGERESMNVCLFAYV